MSKTIKEFFWLPLPGGCGELMALLSPYYRDMAIPKLQLLLSPLYL